MASILILLISAATASLVAQHRANFQAINTWTDILTDTVAKIHALPTSSLLIYHTPNWEITSFMKSSREPVRKITSIQSLTHAIPDAFPHGTIATLLDHIQDRLFHMYGKEVMIWAKIEKYSALRQVDDLDYAYKLKVNVRNVQGDWCEIAISFGITDMVNTVHGVKRRPIIAV